MIVTIIVKVKSLAKVNSWCAWKEGVHLIDPHRLFAPVHLVESQLADRGKASRIHVSRHVMPSILG